MDSLLTRPVSKDEYRWKMDRKLFVQGGLLSENARNAQVT
jgi:hypothetical protein